MSTRPITTQERRTLISSRNRDTEERMSSERGWVDLQKQHNHDFTSPQTFSSITTVGVLASPNPTMSKVYTSVVKLT